MTPEAAPLLVQVIAFDWAATARPKLDSPLRVWSSKKLTESTKIQVYGACVLSMVLYGSESWTLHARQQRQLNTFHIRGLQRILNITWQGNVPNNTVLERAEIPSLYTPLRQRRLRWLGHVVRVDDGRIPKDLLYGELAHSEGKAPLAGTNYASKIFARGNWALTSTFRLEASSAVRPLGVRRDTCRTG